MVQRTYHRRRRHILRFVCTSAATCVETARTKKQEARGIKTCSVPMCGGDFLAAPRFVLPRQCPASLPFHQASSCLSPRTADGLMRQTPLRSRPSRAVHANSLHVSELYDVQIRFVVARSIDHLLTLNNRVSRALRPRLHTHLSRGPAEPDISMITRHPSTQYSCSTYLPHLTRVRAILTVPGLKSVSAVLTGSAFDGGGTEECGTACGYQSIVSARARGPRARGMPMRAAVQQHSWTRWQYHTDWTAVRSGA